MTVLAAVFGAIKIAWTAWQTDRAAVIATLQSGTAIAIERERAVVEALTRATLSGERITDALDEVRVALEMRACAHCGMRLHGRPSPTNEHPAAPRQGGAS